MKRNETGRYRAISATGEDCRAFIPDPLPPRPSLAIGPALREKLDGALLALGRLDSVTTLLPDPSLFLYMYVRKEAVLSSQIEGTQSSLSDLLLFELDQAPGAPLEDVHEVSNYVAALHHGIRRFREGFPLSLRLIREIHEILLQSGRGEGKEPGEFRRTQNWIGGTRPGNALFVPPPPDEVMACMGALEKFLHDDPESVPPLLKAALAHVQFETIHPFLDGNGRVGRLLISFILFSEGVLSEPLLYLSLYFKKNRQRYYDLLQEVRTTGDWEAWLDFFADAVSETAADAVETVRSLNRMGQEHHARLQASGRRAGSLVRVHGVLMRAPVVNIGRVADDTGLTHQTVSRCMAQLEDFDLVREITGKKRNRVFAYIPYLTVLNQGT